MNTLQDTRKILALLAVTLFLAGTLAHAQVQQPLTWQQDLAYLEHAGGDAAAQSDMLAQIRSQVESWLKVHPGAGVKVKLAEAPLKPWKAEQVASEVSALRATVQAILAADPDHPFHLGVTQVDVAATVPDISPLANSFTQTEIQQHDAVNLAQALDYIPGVNIYHIANNRNETTYSIRGFNAGVNNAGQVPLYLDGVPIYVPYDGYIDLNRYLTSDIAEIQVAKGYSSSLLGPGALGGNSINLVTRQPTQKYEAEALMGTGSGDALLSSLHLGTHTDHFFAQGSVDWAQQDYIPLSSNFAYPEGGYVNLAKSGNVPYPLTNDENNSATRDEKYSGRFGYTPNSTDEYVFSYINQKGQKGVPLYMGDNPAASFRNFWDWPYWNMDNYYFLSNTGIGHDSALKTRVFYEQFRNGINMYSNSAEDSLTTSNAEYSRYDDHSDGFSAEFTNRSIARNLIGASFFFKDDTHREYGIYPDSAVGFLYSPEKVLRNQVTSMGIEDAITITSRLKVTAGFSADHLDGLQAQNYNNSNTPTAILPLTCPASPNNSSFSGCTPHFWNNNPQAAATYRLTDLDSVFATFADRGRFPTMKQLYSYGLGSALANPELLPEKGRTFDVGYSHLFPANTFMQVELYRTDLHDAIESALIPDPGWNPLTPTVTKNLYCPSNTSDIAGEQYYCTQDVNVGKETHEGFEFTLRSTPITRLTLDASYAYLNRTIGSVLTTSETLSTPLVLPFGLPKNDAHATATVRLPRHILALVTGRYEGGITLQDTSYSSKSPLYQPYGESFATFDLAAIVPIKAGMSFEAGVKNALDRNYYYSAGYPEEGRNWYTNLRYRF